MAENKEINITSQSMNAKYDVLDIAKYIIHHSNEKNYNISNLRLQKILYFVQAQFIQSLNKPCFNDLFECWEYGPVIPKVYSKYKRNGSLSIPSVKGVTNSVIEINDRILINKIIDQAAKINSFKLVEISHKQNPWKNNYKPKLNCEIPMEDMFKYFRG